MNKQQGTSGLGVLVVLFVALCLIASYIVPLIIFTTVEYDCLVVNCPKEQLVELYSRAGGKSKVWVNSFNEIESGIWHLSLQARDIGGENDIDFLLGDILGWNYYRLDE